MSQNKNCLCKIALLLFLISVSFISGYSQKQTSSESYSGKPTTRRLTAIEEKTCLWINKLDRKNKKYFKRLVKQENRLYKKARVRDSAGANFIFGDIQGIYEQMREKLSQTGENTSRFSRVHLPFADSLKTALQFLSKDNLLLGTLRNGEEINNSLTQLTNLQQKFGNTDNITRQIEQRKKQIVQYLHSTDLGKYATKYKKEVYYYQRQISEFKEVFSNASEMGKKILEIANKVPAFQQFFAQHSELAGLFSLPGNTSTTTSITTGLQTRASVMNSITAFAGNNNASADMLRQNLNQAQGIVNELKAKLSRVANGGGSTDLEMPDFKVNNQRTKSFLKRIETGFNIHSQRRNNILPASSDIGLSLGYKLNDKSIVGIGAAYKMGWGRGFDRIQLTSEGLGLRSFIDIKAKGNIWITGGSELNYISRFATINELKQYDAWQQSALIGITKRIQSDKKLKLNMQILFDVLYKQNIQVTSPLLFRIGYRL